MQGGGHRTDTDFPSAEVSTGLVSMLIAHPAFFSVVAEREGRVVGSNFLDERSIIGGIGPISVDPAEQNSGIGRTLMQAVIDRAASSKMPGIRLLQDSFHNRSLSL